MKTSQEIDKIATALAAAQSDMGNATKDAANPFFKSKFADLNAVREASIPVLNKNGISVLQPMTMEEGRTFVVTMLLHTSGQFISGMTEIVVPANKASDPQAHGAAQSYARRYGLQSLVCIGAEDNDGEGAMDRTPVKKSPPAPVVAKTTPKVEATPEPAEAPAAQEVPKPRFGGFKAKVKKDGE